MFTTNGPALEYELAYRRHRLEEAAQRSGEIRRALHPEETDSTQVVVTRRRRRWLWRRLLAS